MRDADFPKIAIVIPVFNRIGLTVQCLDSLKNIEYPNYEIIVVDHGTTAKISELIKANYPDIVVVDGDLSMWWSKAMNAGIRRAVSNKCEYVLFLNNDDEVDRLILQNCLDCAREYPDAIIGCKVRDFNQPGRIVFAGGDCDWEKSGLFTYGYGEIDEGQYDFRREIKWIPGAGTFVSAQLFMKIGFIDDRTFPHYGADIDFTLRAYEAGYKIIYEPKAVLYKKMEKDGNFGKRKYRFFASVIMPLFSIRSSINLPLQAKFLWRHCPKIHLPRIFFYKYYDYYKSFLNLKAISVYLKSKIPHGEQL